MASESPASAPEPRPPRVFLSYSHDSPAHASRVLALAQQLRRDGVDALLAKVDSVELGKLSPRVFRLAEWLLKEHGDAVAQRYFEKGLEGNSWALPQQLTLGATG